MKIKVLQKINSKILMLFIMFSTISLSDANSDAFAQVFREASKQSDSKKIIERVVNSLYYGLLAIYRGVSLKISQLCGFILIAFMIISILKIILQNIDKVDVYTIMKMILPTFVKNIIIAFILVTPITYNSTSGLTGGGMVNGTILTRMVEAIFTMFYRLGLIFFNDPKFNNATPGRIADIFFSRPLNLLEKTFSFMTFFAVFISIAKVILLIVCLWICGKIISVYIANIFMALMLTTFSIFYLLFLTMEGTAQIGHRGINTIIVQSVTLFMTVAMMGISYQVMRLIAVGDSISGIASMTVILFMLEQVIENISGMAVAITSGGGLGQSKGDAFLGLASAFGSMAGGIAMMGLAKLDELKEGNTKESESELFSKENNTKEDNRNSRNEKDREIMAKANRNVENEASGRYSGSSSNSSNTSDNGLGVRYRKGRGVPKNFKKAEDSFRDYKDMKKKSGLGINSKIGLGAGIFFQVITGDQSDAGFYKALSEQIKNATGNQQINNGEYPYNVLSQNMRQQVIGADIFKDGWRQLKKQITSEPNLNPEMGALNDAIRGNAYNYGDEKKDSKGRPNNLENNRSNDFNNTTLLMNNLENQSRNNFDRITTEYKSPEKVRDMTKNATKDYRDKTQ
jgi:membrane protein